MFVAGVCAASGARVEISAFASNTLSGWQAKSFSGATSYNLVEDSNRTVLRAVSSNAASGLVKKIRIDLRKTPYVNWSWKIDNQLEGIDETVKKGDDYPARLYLVKSGGALVWRTKALNYVWSSTQQRGSAWPNAFSPKNSAMLATRGVADTPGHWVVEKRNVREDFKKAFGVDIKRIDAVALMTDTDNTGRSARAYYGDIYFTAD